MRWTLKLLLMAPAPRTDVQARPVHESGRRYFVRLIPQLSRPTNCRATRRASSGAARSGARHTPQSTCRRASRQTQRALGPARVVPSCCHAALLRSTSQRHKPVCKVVRSRTRRSPCYRQRGHPAACNQTTLYLSWCTDSLAGLDLLLHLPGEALPRGSGVVGSALGLGAR